ncbi:MAG: flagellar motor switch protein FliN [Gammaproteobacteria bacterium]|nr:flagellar motor switch protein FliN [Gammaproteobacteria bacterium]
MSIESIELSELEVGAGGKSLLGYNLELIKDVKVKIQVMLGEAEIPVQELFGLAQDSVVKLNREITAPVDILLNGKVIARGKLVAADDNFGVQITQIEE